MSKDKASRQTPARVAGAIVAALTAALVIVTLATTSSQAQVQVARLPQIQTTSVIQVSSVAGTTTVAEIAAIKKSAAARSQVAGARVVTVAPGDTLSRIAQRQCGAQGYWPSLWQANSGKISNPDLIYPGQQLTISCVRTDSRASRSSARSTTSSAGTWVHPLAAGTRGGSCWGAPRSGHMHQGVDLTQPSGTSVRAVHAGTVVLSRWANGGGNTVAVDHGDGTQSVYMHLVTKGAGVGTRVQAGTVIGRVGSTGNSTGPHLHFEIHKGLWNRVNPAPFMRSHGVNIGC